MFRSFALALCLVCAGLPAAAGCQATYKAKQDNPLKLDYGTLAIPDNKCTMAEAQAHVRSVLAGRGWILLNIVSVQKN